MLAAILIIVIVIAILFSSALKYIRRHLYFISSGDITACSWRHLTFVLTQSWLPGRLGCELRPEMSWGRQTKGYVWIPTCLSRTEVGSVLGKKVVRSLKKPLTASWLRLWLSFWNFGHFEQKQTPIPRRKKTPLLAWQNILANLFHPSCISASAPSIICSWGKGPAIFVSPAPSWVAGIQEVPEN